MRMRIIFLGTGAALPDPDRCHTSILLTLNNGRHFLLDCGHGATRQMMRVNVNPADVAYLLLTHLHHDHVCELPFFVISSWILSRPGALDIRGPKGTQKLVSHLFEGGAFDADIRARSAFPVRQANIEAVRPKVTEYEAGVIFEDRDIKVTADHMDHIPPEISPCFGFRIEAEGKVVTFSGDTAPCEGIARLSQGADLLIHECTFTEAFIEHRRKSQVESGRVRALAVASEKRVPSIPLPTAIESGVPNFVTSNWWGLAAPRATPQRVQDRIYRAVVAALADPGIAKRLDELGYVPRGEPSRTFRDEVDAEAKVWSETISRGKLAVE
jgi:ribonuclease Z